MVAFNESLQKGAQGGISKTARLRSLIVASLPELFGDPGHSTHTQITAATGNVKS